jgi:hypothetical protein
MGLRTLAACALVAASVARVRAGGLTPDDLARKNEGSHVTGVPLAAYSVDFGFGGGARVYYFWNGMRADPRFAETPYLHRIFVQAFATTRGTQYHWIDYDAPRILDSEYRVRAQLVLGRNTNANYFGHGDVQRRLRFPGSSTTFGKLDDYVDAEQRSVGGTAYSKYDQFDLLRPVAIASLERAFLGRRVRVMGGFGVGYARIRDYTGKQVDAVDEAGMDVQAIQAPTRVREDCDAGTLVGCDGGWDSFLRVGAAYDTRDFEPDPNRGVFADLEIDGGTTVLGSAFSYVRAILAVRGWWSPIPDRADLVLAGRFYFYAQSAGTPFFKMNELPFTEDPRFGMGGHRTLRGFRQDRFVDHVMSGTNAEIRWTFARTEIKRQKLAFIVAPFVDLGRTFSQLADLTPRGWFASYGGALRISWNLSTLVTADYGFCSEGSGFYANFGHTF